MLKVATVLLALIFAGLVFARYADAQECCPISEALWKSAPPPLAGIYTSQVQPYHYGPVFPLYRPRAYEFTGYIVIGVPVYRRLP